MAVTRTLVLLLLVAAGVCFGLYAITGNVRYKRWGWRIAIGTLIAALFFFAVLVAQQWRGSQKAEGLTPPPTHVHAVGFALQGAHVGQPRNGSTGMGVGNRQA